MSAEKPVPRAARYDVRLAAELRLGTSVISGTTRNLSASGVCIEIDRPVAEATAISIKLIIVEEEIEAEGRAGLDLAGTVQWTAESDRGYAVGVKFVNMTEAQLRALSNALKALPPA